MLPSIVGACPLTLVGLSAVAPLAGEGGCENSQLARFVQEVASALPQGSFRAPILLYSCRHHGGGGGSVRAIRLRSSYGGQDRPGCVHVPGADPSRRQLE